MRLFLAVTPDPDTCRAINAWRNQCWPVISRAVPVQNYHLTLTFLGDVTARQLSSLEVLAADWPFPPFKLTLNDIGYWPDARCLWLGRTHSQYERGDEPIDQLASRCATIANRIGVRTGKKTFIPHITLARGIDTPPAQALIEPHFDLEIASVELYQSVRERSGARYIEMASWTLGNAGEVERQQR